MARTASPVEARVGADRFGGAGLYGARLAEGTDSDARDADGDALMELAPGSSAALQRPPSAAQLRMSQRVSSIHALFVAAGKKLTSTEVRERLESKHIGPSQPLN